MECLENKDIKKTSRRSKKVKNLEQEVELILSQEESDDDIVVKDEVNEILPVTPSKNDKLREIATPRASQAALQDMLQTPRRSCRKSIKPTQEYDDIVNKSCSRSNRSTKINLTITEEEDQENLAEPVPAQPKWTPAKVGRVSQKRGRKSRRNTKTKKANKEKVTEGLELSPEVVNDVQLDDMESLAIIDTKNEDNIVPVKPLEIINLNKHLNSPENPRESLNEFMEIEKQINKLHTHDVSKQITQDSEVVKETPCEQKNDVPIQIIQADPDDVKYMPTEETNDVSIHLIQEDSEDVKELPSEKIEEKTDQLEDSFGCYLKSKEINISDLGLNALKDDDEDLDDKEITKKKENDIDATNELEEMPSLIVCDDDEEMAKEQPNKLNETFEANDSVVIIEATPLIPAKSSQDVMESLIMSDDDGETPKKAPRIMLTTAELQNQTLLATPNPTSTLKQPAIAQLPSTPKQATKAFRFPTPYRNRHNFKFNKAEENVENEIPKNLRNCSWMSSVTSLEPKDIVLRGIRKRSLSVCIDGDMARFQKPLARSLAKRRQDRMVSFFSPANQTTIIDDLDLVIAKSLKKQKIVDTNESSNKFVTTRRKRSMSVDESLLSSSMLMSRLPRPVPIKNTPNKSQTSTSKPLTRTKLPNFAAIHNKNFQKMENLVDHVNRKQERSKVLINSNTKIRPASAQKNSVIKTANNNIEKPKALKKIDLGVSSAKMPNTSIIASHTTLTSSNTDIVKSQENLSKIRKLPHPQAGVTKVIKTGTIPQRIPHSYHNQKASIAAAAPPLQPIRKYLKPSQSNNTTINRIPAASTSSSTVVKHKPIFNLSTSIMKPNSTSSSMENLNKIPTTTSSSDDKMASRLQRHMDLFKGRVPATRAGVASRRNEAVIRGVRSNRRFELQMQHRKNMEN